MTKPKLSTIVLALTTIAFWMLPFTATAVLMPKPEPQACFLVKPTQLLMWWV